jgi:ABC-2 type transport system permease protein
VRTGAPGLTRAVVALAGQTLRNSLRRPQLLAPLLLFPSLLIAVNVGGLERTTQLPGFPRVHGFLDFQLAAGILQSLLLGGVQAGIGTALEIEGGFFQRLVVAPIPRLAIVFGRVAAAGVLALGQTVVFLALGLALGVRMEGGLPGVVLVLALGTLAGVGFGAVGVSIALRARNASVVQGIFPLVFVALFASTAFFPSGLLSAPVDSLSAYNPLSYLADGMRNPIIAGISARTVLEGFAAAFGIAAVAVAASVVTLRGRLREA